MQTSADKKIIVPQSLYTQWLAAEGWSDLAQYIESDGAPDTEPEIAPDSDTPNDVF